MDASNAGPIRWAELPHDVSSRLVLEAERAGSEEACGLLVGVREAERVRVGRAVRCENTLPAERRARRFAIDPRRVIEEERNARASSEGVVGFYHSHPVGEPVPSSVDRGFMALWPDAVWVIVAPNREPDTPTLRGWVVAPDPSEPPLEVAIEYGPREADGGPTTNTHPREGRREAEGP